MGAYQSRLRRALAIQAVGGLAALVVIFVLIEKARELPLAGVLIGLTLAGALAVAAGLPWWRRADEMERETHMTAWYSGSILGALAAMLWMMGVWAHTGAHRELGVGAGLCFGAQGVFYLIFWAIRRFGRRAPVLA